MGGVARTWYRQDPAQFTMLTINADDHPFMRNYHKPEDEKRMVIILPKGLYGDWFKAPTGESMEFMREYPADRMKVTM